MSALLPLLPYRRSVHSHDSGQPLDGGKFRLCLRRVRLAPSSSNMQLYEFYHVTGAMLLCEP